MYISDEIFTKIRRKFYLYWSALEDQMTTSYRSDNTLNVTSQQEMSINAGRGFKIKLQVLTIPMFHGENEHFLQFFRVLGRWKSKFNCYR